MIDQPALIRLHPEELSRLQNRIDDMYRRASMDHELRMKKFQGYYRKFRNLTDGPLAGNRQKPTANVPFLQWQTLTKWSSVMQAILGDDAEVLARAVGPHDQKLVKKVSRYVNWLIFESMRATNPLAVFFFRAIVFGRSHAAMPYKTESFYSPETGKREVSYEGPDFRPLWPDQIVVPAENPDVQQGIDGFSWVIERSIVQPNDLLLGEQEGRYYNISAPEFWDKIVKQAESGELRDVEQNQDSVQEAGDEAEGVTRNYSQSGAGLEMQKVYIKYRLPKKNRKDVAADDWRNRNLEESELLVNYLPRLNLIVGIRDRQVMYPRSQKRIPIVESALIQDGTYWGPGFGELLSSIQDQLTDVDQRATRAEQFSTGPVIFYNAQSGFNAQTFEYEPYTCCPVNDASGVQVVQMQANFEGAIIRSQAIKSYGESVTGQNDQSLGRSIDRPNAPRTAAGQIALIEQGNIRAYLDTMFLREDLSKILKWAWALEATFAGPKKFFRVTEESADGLFERRKGGAIMTADEFAGAYDFDIKFATSYWSKEAQKERDLQLFGFDLQNPLFLTNPQALWHATNRIHKAMGDDNLAAVLPQPPELDLPKSPSDEWTIMLQGEAVAVNPQDNDDLHLMQHYGQMQDERDARTPDQKAMQALTVHIIAHEKQKRVKMLMQAMASNLSQTIAANTQNGTPGLNASGGMSMSMAQLQGFLAEMTGQQGGTPGGKTVAQAAPGAGGGGGGTGMPGAGGTGAMPAAG